MPVEAVKSKTPCSTHYIVWLYCDTKVAQGQGLLL